MKTSKQDRTIEPSRRGFLVPMLWTAIALLILALAALLSSARLAPKEEVGAAYPLLNPLRKFIRSEDLIVNFQPLREYLNDTYESDPGVSVYFEYLPTGANISISKDAEFFPASLLKLPVAMAAIMKIQRGEWKWQNELVLMAGDKDDRFGDLYKDPIGTRYTIEELVRKTLVESDNTSYYILLRNLETSELEEVYDHLGLQDFFAKDGKISAKRYAVVLRSLYQGAYLSPENANKALEMLSETRFDDYLQNRLPKDVRFAHKIGVSDEDGVFMDAGIVYLDGRSYILIVMTSGKGESDAKGIMDDISDKVYRYVTGYKAVDKES
ncbi:MAG: serine hydrolase [Candidatus Taylorbacteria bacterium]|nr:serine hydrolase [Candidatus Taylorbacteria bacterium]